MSTDNPFTNPGDTRPPLGLIAGPTASGKSDYAMRLARALMARGQDPVIINSDSAQLYADLPILSAAPTAQDTAEIPHRLYGAWDGAQTCSAADWAARARDEIALAHARGAVPILVGGTGMYMRTLLDGIAPVPAIAPDIREVVRAMPVADAHAALTREDPQAAQRLNSADTTRVARALEVVRSTGRTLAQWQTQKVGGIGHAVALHPLVLIPDRAWLYERCDRRFGIMVDQGAVEEVERLMARALPADLPVMRAIGVAQIAGALNGAWSMEEAIAMGTQATRNYAKRQYTWFRHQPPESWARAHPGKDESFTMEMHFGTLLRD